MTKQEYEERFEIIWEEHLLKTPEKIKPFLDILHFKMIAKMFFFEGINNSLRGIKAITESEVESP